MAKLQATEELYLGRNVFAPLEVKYISDYLRTDHKLQLLDLERCSIQDDGVYQLVLGLEQNRTLLRLSLHDNEITASGAVALASALIMNSKLEYLVMSGNKIG